MNSRSRTPLIISISLVIGIIIGFFMVPSGNSKEYSVQSGKMAYILSLINAQYVDKVDMDSLENEAIRSFLADLDPQHNWQGGSVSLWP